MIVAAQSKIRQKRRVPQPSIQPAAVQPHHVAVIPTGWGFCGVAWKLPSENPDHFPNGFVEQPADALLCRIILPGLGISDLRGQLLKRYPGATEVLGDRRGNFHPEVVPRWFTELVAGFQAYYVDNVRECPIDGPRVDFSDSWQFWQAHLDWSQLTPFRQAVLRETAAIPRGEQLTYGQIARRVGKPSASRAVGAALGSNPWPLLIPCHRVVGSSGQMTGFSAPGGVHAKQRMLAMEQAGLLPG